MKKIIASANLICVYAMGIAVFEVVLFGRLSVDDSPMPLWDSLVVFVMGAFLFLHYYFLHRSYRLGSVLPATHIILGCIDIIGIGSFINFWFLAFLLLPPVTFWYIITLLLVFFVFRIVSIIVLNKSHTITAHTTPIHHYLIHAYLACTVLALLLQVYAWITTPDFYVAYPIPRVLFTIGANSLWGTMASALFYADTIILKIFSIVWSFGFFVFLIVSYLLSFKNKPFLFIVALIIDAILSIILIAYPLSLNREVGGAYIFLDQLVSISFSVLILFSMFTYKHRTGDGLRGDKGGDK